MMLFKNKKFDLPKKPKKAINYYVEEKIPLLLKDNPNINQKILLKQIMKEWERKEISDKANYNFNFPVNNDINSNIIQRLNLINNNPNYIKNFLNNSQNMMNYNQF